MVGLTIDAERLAEIRRRRVRAIAAGSGARYADLAEIYEELEQAEKLHKPAGLPRDRRQPAGHRGVRGPLCRARGGTPPGRPRGSPVAARMSDPFVYDFSRGIGRDALAAGREGREPGRDDADRPARYRTASRSRPRPASPTSRNGGAAARAASTARSARAPGRASSSAPASGWATRNDPLLVSVRSGAVLSMPGMMDTILNLGMNDESVQGLAEAGGGERFALDSYRRFVQMYGDVVAGVDGHLFEDALARMKLSRGVAQRRRADGRRPRARWSSDVPRDLPRARPGEEFPQDPARAAGRRDRRRVRVVEQPARRDLPPRVRHPRRPGHGRQHRADGVRQHGRRLRHRRLPSPATRRPARASCTASSCVNAQGEDVVAGIRTPEPLAELEARCCRRRSPQLTGQMDAARAALPGHAGHRVHDRAGHALHAADAHRQAHRRGRGQDRPRPGGGGRDRPRGGAASGRRPASSTSCCTRRSTPRPQTSG